MAKRSFSNPAWSPGVGTADNVAYTTLLFQAIGASVAATGLNVSEIYIGGQATSSAVMIMVFARDSTLGATLTPLASPVVDGPLDSRTPVAQVNSLTFIAATTLPVRTNTTTSAKLNLSLNAFGGIVRWVAYPGEEWGITNIVVSTSESALSSFTGSTAASPIGSHIIYEAF